MNKKLVILSVFALLIVAIACDKKAKDSKPAKQATQVTVKQVTIDSVCLTDLQKNRRIRKSRIDSLNNVLAVYKEILGKTATPQATPKATIDSTYLATLRRDDKMMSAQEDSLRKVIETYKELILGKQTPCPKETVKTEKRKQKKVVTVSSSVSTEVVSENSFKPPTDSRLKTVSTYETSLNGVTYVGLTDGDFYITISPDNYVQYVFSKKLYDEAGGTNVPELNYKGSGKMFELVGDAFVYVESSTPVTASALNKDWTWSVYVGDKEGYSAYIPHELIKADIMRVKGTLAGTISQEDVDKIGEFVPEVQTGRIKPNKITAIGDFDNLTYEGWLFCTKMTYKQE